MMLMKKNYFKTFLHEGELILGRKNQNGKEYIKSKNLDRDFRALFGCSPVCCSVVWVKCGFSKNVEPKHLLWALMFLRTYDNELTLVTTAKETCRKFFRATIWPIIKKIAELRKKVVSTELVFYVDIYFIFESKILNRYCGKTGSRKIEEKPVRCQLIQLIVQYRNQKEREFQSQENGSRSIQNGVHTNSKEPDYATNSPYVSKREILFG